MKWTRLLGLLVPLTLLTLFVGSTPLAADQERGKFKTVLSGFQVVPSNVTTGHGEFEAKIDDSTIEFELTYTVEGTATGAHLHVAQRGVNGGLAVDLCAAGTGCPASALGTVTGTIVAGEVLGPAAQGIPVGNIDELIRAIRAGVTYVEVHSSVTGGDIRGQVGRGEGRGRGRGHD